MAFSKNPLFRRASQKVQQAARREWKQTTAAKAIDQVHTALRSNGRTSAGGNVRKAIDQWGKAGWTDVVRSSMLSTDFGSMVHEVSKYARMGGSTGRLVSEFLGSMGPIGSLIRSVLNGATGKRSSGLEGDIQSAIDFLDAVAPSSLSSRGRKRSRVKKPTATAKRSTLEVAQQIEQAKAFLEGQGFEVKPAAGTKVGGSNRIAPDDPLPQEKTYPGGVPKTTSRGQQRKVVDIDVGGGRKRFPVTHPIVTKRMIPTPGSSNVYSYSYDVDSWKLYVRFQANNSPGTAGSLYSYANVPPQVFLTMISAPSKGTFIWDNIRMRGTISGHRYDYSLVAVKNDYVPRKATMTDGGEMLVQRSVRVKRVDTGKIEVLKSGGSMRPGAHLYR